MSSFAMPNRLPEIDQLCKALGLTDVRSIDIHIAVEEVITITVKRNMTVEDSLLSIPLITTIVETYGVCALPKKQEEDH